MRLTYTLPFLPQDDQVCRFTSDKHEFFKGAAGVCITTYTMVRLLQRALKAAPRPTLRRMPHCTPCIVYAAPRPLLAHHTVCLTLRPSTHIRAPRRAPCTRQVAYSGRCIMNEITVCFL